MSTAMSYLVNMELRLLKLFYGEFSIYLSIWSPIGHSNQVGMVNYIPVVYDLKTLHLGAMSKTVKWQRSASDVNYFLGTNY